MLFKQIGIMASCDVQETPPNGKSVNSTTSTPPSETAPTVPLISSSTPLSTTVPVRNQELVTVKKMNPKIPICSTPNKITKITETSVHGSTKTIYQNPIKVLPTKIPAPIHMGNNCNSRKYTSLMKCIKRKPSPKDESFGSTSTLVNLTEDSGIHMDCSALEDDVSVGQLHFQQPEQQLSSETIKTTGSLYGLDTDEKQTLRVLQRAVAEMEEDLELHSIKYMEEIEHEEARQMNDTKNDGVEMVNKCEYPSSQLNQQSQDEQPQPEIEQEVPVSTGSMCEEIASSSTRSTTIRERKHVRVEQLLEAEHDIELLQKLLRLDEQLDSPIADALPIDELSHLEQNTIVLEEKIVNSLDEDDQSDQTVEQVGFLYSFLNIFCGKNIRKISCPLLFCGLAVGLIFYFRKM